MMFRCTKGVTAGEQSNHTPCEQHLHTAVSRCSARLSQPRTPEDPKPACKLLISYITVLVLYLAAASSLVAQNASHATFDNAPIIIGQDTYAKAMDRLNDEYTFHDYASAMQDARIVLAFDPHEFRAYYYMALIEFSQNRPDDALRYANRALEFADGSFVRPVQALIASATAMQNAASMRDRALADQAAGLYSKAAGEFEQAYRTYPPSWSLGVAAANLYVALDDLPNAAFVMRKIAAGSDHDASYVAAQWLLDSNDLLQSTAQTLVDQANKLVEGDLLWKADQAQRQLALSDYAEALKASPRCEHYPVCTWILLDRVKLFNGDLEAIKSDMKMAASNNLVLYPSAFHYFHIRNNRLEEVYDGAWLPLLCDSSFVHYLRDVFGDDAARVADDTCLQVPASARGLRF